MDTEDIKIGVTVKFRNEIATIDDINEGYYVNMKYKNGKKYTWGWERILKSERIDTMEKTDMELLMEKWGVELDEEFKIEWTKDMYSFRNIYDHLSLYKTDGNDYDEDLVMLKYILNGQMKIIKKPWRPKINELYSYIDSYGIVAHRFYTQNNIGDKLNMLVGNMYKTDSIAEKYVPYWKRVYADMPEFKEVEK